MLFWLQKEYENDIDVMILRNELDKQRYMHSYNYCSLESLLNDFGGFITDAYETKRPLIPVGSLEYVSAFLKKFHNIENMNPIEVPDCLRQDEFLKRKYSIVNKKYLPKQGYFFIKYVSQLKVFSHTGLIERLFDSEFNNDFLKDGLYQVSEVVEIISEYRCFIHDDELIAMNYYDGNCTVLPDMKTIQKAILTYMLDKYRPKAYTMDIAVIKDRGTAIIEIHPWVSVGLYGYMFGSSLPYCYRDGFNWYIDCNKSIKEFSNF